MYRLKELTEVVSVLANIYESKCDFVNAIGYYKMSIDGGNCKCLYNLGYCFDVIGDYNNAVKYYKMAVDNNDCRAMYNLASYYKKINDDINALMYYKMAMSSGYIDE